MKSRIAITIALVAVIAACLVSSFADSAGTNTNVSVVNTDNVTEDTVDDLPLSPERYEELVRLSDVFNETPDAEGYDILQPEDKEYIVYNDLSKEAALYFAATHENVVVKHIAGYVSYCKGTRFNIRSTVKTFHMAMLESDMPTLGSFVTVWCVVEK